MIEVEALSSLSVYAPGDGSLVVRNPNHLPLDEDDLITYVARYKANLVGYEPFNVNKGAPSYWHLRRPFTPLSGDSIPVHILDDISGKTYKVKLVEYNDGDTFTLWNTKLLDMDGNEVHNHGLRMGFCFWMNHRY